MPNKKDMYMMTSCDDGLALYILPQLAAIGENLKQYRVHFYLFHSSIAPEHIEMLRAYAETVGSIVFYEVKITDIAPYEAIAEGGGGFPIEAYFSLCCHDYLPSDIERILYIDAGDVIITGDLAEYYFADFEGHSLIATAHKYTLDNDGIHTDALSSITDPKRLAEILENVKAGKFDFAESKIKMRPFRQDDMSDIEKLQIMLVPGAITTGCYVINVEQFRTDGRAMGDYLYLAQMLRGVFPDRKRIYLGDQGFMSVAFAGEIKCFGFPETADPRYMPYDFGMWYFNQKSSVDYTPVVLHFGGTLVIKPWKARFSAEEIKKYDLGAEPRKFHAPCYLMPQYAEWFEIWWKYCEMTPVYEELNRVARTAAAALEKHYLPLCKWYNELADEYIQATGKNPQELLQRMLQEEAE